MERIFNTVCILVACAAIALTAMNFVNNPVEAKRRQLDLELAEATGRQFDAGGEDFVWPFEEWQTMISSRMRVWDGLIEPPKQERRQAVVQRPPEWSELLQGVRVLKREMGGKVKIIYPGSDPAGDYVPVGGVIGKGVSVKSFDRTSVTFSHTFAPTGTTRSHTVQRVNK